MNRRYSSGFKEATTIFHKKKTGVGTPDDRTQQGIIDDLNDKWKLNGEGREGSREQQKLAVRTISKAVAGVRIQTQQVYARKLKANAREVIRKKQAIAERVRQGKKVSDAEMRKVNTVVTLKNYDLGAIVYGDLGEDGSPHPDSPIAKYFTRERILAATAKVSQLIVVSFYYYLR